MESLPETTAETNVSFNESLSEEAVSEEVSSFNESDSQNLTIGITGEVISRGIISGSVVADIKRVDAAGAATSLISGSSAFATGSSIEKMFAIPLIIPSTLIKIGEKIRLTIEQWRNDSGGSPAASTHYLGHDPKNRADTTITTIDTNLIIEEDLLLMI